MATALVSTGVQFPDATIQTTAATASITTGSYILAPNSTNTIFTTFLSGSGTTATAYLYPSTTISVGSSITITGATPSGYNTSLSPVLTSSTTSFSCTGSISGTTLTVSAVTGTITVGAVLAGSNVLANTVITAGSGSSWTVSLSQTVASTTVTGLCGVITYANTTTGAQTVAGTIFVTPVGFLLSNGSVYNRSAYPALAAYIGYPTSAAPSVVANTGTNTYSRFNHLNGYLLTANPTTSRSSALTAAADAYTYTSDGVTWTAATGWTPGNIVGGNNYQMAAYLSGIYMVAILQGSQTIGSIAYGSSISTITNKVTVVTVAGGYLSTGCSLTAGGTSNVFVASFNSYLCCGSGVAATYVYSSTNGTSWSSVTLPGIVNSSYFSVVGGAGYSGGVVLIQNVGASSHIWYSASGAGTYTDITSNFGTMTVTNYPTNVSYANGQFILTMYGNIYVSQTGASGTWSIASTYGFGAQNGIFPISWNGTYYAQGTFYSADLKNWQTSPSSPYGSVALGTKFYGQNVSNGSQSWGASLYSATQFPTPSISSPTVASFQNSGVTPIGYFIKT